MTTIGTINIDEDTDTATVADLLVLRMQGRDFLLNVLATVLFDTDESVHHPKHAVNRVNLAMRLAAASVAEGTTVAQQALGHPNPPSLHTVSLAETLKDMLLDR